VIFAKLQFYKVHYLEELLDELKGSSSIWTFEHASEILIRQKNPANLLSTGFGGIFYDK